jgi:sensor histidine kinase YesM
MEGVILFSYLLLRMVSSVSGVLLYRLLYGARDLRSYLYIDTLVNEFLLIPDSIISSPLYEILGNYVQGVEFSVIYSILTANIGVVMGIVMAKFYFRSKIKRVYSFLVEVPRVCLAITLIYYVLDCFLYIEGTISEKWILWEITRVCLILIIPVIAREFIQKRKLRESQELITQQQNYLSRLEDVQSQLRMIQHDYKNMISGLYTQVSEGNITDAKKYMDEKLLKFDQHIQSEIQQMNQLARIKDPNLKSLIITKLMMMIQEQVAAHVEIPMEIDQVSMEIEDLIRCLGILLDNAMEAVVGHEDARVVLVMSKESEKLVIMIKNDIYTEVDIARIYQEGYSTKGANRGLGLSSLRQIIQKYENVMQEMELEEGQFIQSITIIRKKG